MQQRESACGFFPLYGVRHILKTQSKAIYKPAYMSFACVFTAWQTGNSIGSRPFAMQQRESACGFFPLYGVRHILKTQSKAIYKPAYMSFACVFTAWQTGRNIGDRPSAVQQRESACGFFPLYGVRHILKNTARSHL